MTSAQYFPNPTCSDVSEQSAPTSGNTAPPGGALGDTFLQNNHKKTQ